MFKHLKLLWVIFRKNSLSCVTDLANNNFLKQPIKCKILESIKLINQKKNCLTLKSHKRIYENYTLDKYKTHKNKLKVQTKRDHYLLHV